MDKNTVIGIVLIGLILIGFSILNKPTPGAQQEVPVVVTDTMLAQSKPVEAVANPADTLNRTADSLAPQVPMYLQKSSERTITLRNELLTVDLSTLGGVPTRAELLKYKAQDNKPLVLFEGEDLLFNLPMRTVDNNLVETDRLYFEPMNVSDTSVTMRLNIATAAYLDFVYTLRANDYRMNMHIEGKGLNHLLPANMSLQDLEWNQKVRQQEQSWKFENQYTALMYRYAAGGLERITRSKKDKTVQESLRWVGYQDKYFSTVLISDAAFEDNKISVTEMAQGSGYVKEFKLKSTLQWNISDGKKASFTWFMGPNDYNLLKGYDKGVSKDDKLNLDHLIYMGGKVFRFINIYMIIPVVTWLNGSLTNWGLIILILTLLIKLFLTPFTFKSYQSQAKMRVLKPQVEAINAKYPGNEQDMMMKRQTETMSLYRAAGAGPMSGCVPMLLQMPFLIALYMYFPTSILLRGESFLWAKDLSTYDAIISWNFDIPFLSSIMGNHISLFCLLMSVVNIAFNKYIMQQNSSPAQEGMKMMKYMPYFMYIFLFFFFNQNASGLCYYYLLTSVITMLQNIGFKYAINEEKLLARLEENKKKPRKKSKWIQRLEEAQRQQQAMQRQQNKRR